MKTYVEIFFHLISVVVKKIYSTCNWCQNKIKSRSSVCEEVKKYKSDRGIQKSINYIDINLITKTFKQFGKASDTSRNSFIPTSNRQPTTGYRQPTTGNRHCARCSLFTKAKITTTDVSPVFSI